MEKAETEMCFLLVDGKISEQQNIHPNADS